MVGTPFLERSDNSFPGRLELCPTDFLDLRTPHQVRKPLAPERGPVVGQAFECLFDRQVGGLFVKGVPGGRGGEGEGAGAREFGRIFGADSKAAPRRVGSQHSSFVGLHQQERTGTSRPIEDQTKAAGKAKFHTAVQAELPQLFQTSAAHLFPAQHDKRVGNDGGRMSSHEQMKSAAIGMKADEKFVCSTGRAKVQDEVVLRHLGEFLKAGPDRYLP